MPARAKTFTVRLRSLPQHFRRSLIARILGVHAIGIVVAAALTLGSVNLLLHLRTRGLEHQRLEDQATDIIQGIRVNRDGQLHVDYGATTLARNSHGPFSFIVRATDGDVRLSSSDAAVARLLDIRLSLNKRFLVLRDGDVLSTVTHLFNLKGQHYWITVAWNLSAPGVIFDNILDGFLGYSTAIALALLSVLLCVDLLVMRVSLRPLLRVAQSVRQSQRCDDYRLGLHQLPREILPMAKAYNDALDRAEDAHRLQREFTADAAHELRTPLAVLQARIETLEPSATRRHLVLDVQLMSRIVSQLLQIASQERSATDAPHATDPAAVCRDVVEALAPMAVAAQRELGLTLPKEAVPHLWINGDDLFQVLRNLVENAIHHTGPGTCIDVAVSSDGMLTVSDDGPGIPADLQGKVFERFWRRERRTGNGAGLGLAIVHRLVARSGGTVELESDVGKGCRFTVRLSPVRHIAL